MRKKLLLVGYSGHQNYGDDLLLELAYRKFVDLCELTIWTNVLTEDASYLETWFPKATVIRSKKLGLQVFKQFDKVLYFGGGVFFDYTENYPLGKYLRKRLATFKNYNIARLYGTQFGGIGIGLGPFLSKRARFINRYRLSNFQLLGLRDDFSYDVAKEYNLKAYLVKGCDLSFASDYMTHKNQAFQAHSGSILICPRKFPHNNTADNYHERLVDWAVEQQKADKKITVFGFQSKHDEAILKIYSAKGLKTEIWNPHVMRIEDVFKLFARHQFIISARMHGIYLAGLVGRGSIGINVHPKVKDAASIFNNSTFLNQNFTTEALNQKLNSLFQVNAELNYQEKISSARKLYEVAQNWVNNYVT